jgi:hypothetical protein
MKYPHGFQPSGVETIKLPSGRMVEIPKATALFSKWNGKPVSTTYGGKFIAKFNGRPAFAELVILRSFRTSGWNGVWVDTFGSSFRTRYWPKNSIDLPSKQESLLETIYKKAGSTGGCWDVFCWKGALVMFVEAKRKRQDSLKPTQLRWLEAAIECGLPLDTFLVVEWDVKTARVA